MPRWVVFDAYKSYPNAYLDLCWVQAIDPVYTVEFLKRALVSVPHNKILAFGGDTDYIEHTVGLLSIARDTVAFALSDMVDCKWLNMNEAKQVACDWFYNNPNEFFGLGLEPVKV